MTDHSLSDEYKPTSEYERGRADRMLAIYRGKPTELLGRMQLNCHRHGGFFSIGHRLTLPNMPPRDIWQDCQDCKREQQDQAQRERAALDLVHAMRERASRVHGAGIPLRFRDRAFETYKATTPGQIRALTMARDYVEQFAENRAKGLGLVMAGHPGTGKSHLSSSIMLSLVDRYVVRYVTCMEMIQEIRATWRRDSDRSEGQALEEFGATIDLLVVDEVGVQYGTDGEQTLLFGVLDQRYRNMLPTILLTNQDKDGFRGFVGERVMDRLTETAKWIPFKGESYRATARKEAA
ncbi:ATP-binding protein [Polaromonas sp. JS666]|uniref:ATP-binding protein n=1 Tax=Polaromonas sp. (strain JS666 / ATCC BAA-500) TaxID=296591 RepID=UPI0008860A25|nr:ATP-binding protein [Polaromonas sp. JS666]SDN51492.1 phage DNA replication protein (predicted replicative helicase loader) [Polaromonas sp. JS666]